MKAVWRAIRANLRSRKGQHLLVFLTLAAAALLLVVAVFGYFSGYRIYDRLMASTNGAHIWLSVDGKTVSAEEVRRAVHANPEVTAATEPMATFRATVEAANGKKAGVLLRDLNPDRKIARLLWVEGRAPKPSSAEIALDNNLARALGVHVGDKVKVWLGKTPNTFTVSGTFITSEFCDYPDCKPARAYTGEGTLAAAMKAHGVKPNSWDVGLQIRHPERAEAVLEALRHAFPADATVEGYTWQLVRRFAGLGQQMQSVFVLVFAVMAIVVAGFLIANAVAGALRSQTRQIGLLRAVGFTNGQLALMYLGEYLLIALTAAAVGMAAGIPISRGVFAQLAETYAVGTPLPPLGALLAVLVAILGLVVLAAAFPLRRIARMDTVTAIRQGMEPPRRRPVRLLRLPFPLAYGLTSLFATPARSALTSLGLAVGALAIAVALSLGATVAEFTRDPVGMGIVPNADLIVWAGNGISSSKVLAAVKARDDVLTYACQATAGVRLKGGKRDLYPRLICGDWDLFANMLLEGRLPQAEDEAVAAYTIFHQHGWHLGDKVVIVAKGQEHTFRIVGVYRDINNLGQMFLLPLRAFPQQAPNLIYIKLKPNADPNAVLADLKSQFGERLDGEVLQNIFKNDDSGRDMGKILKTTVIVLSVLLGLLTAVGVLSSLSLSVAEERRTVGILKALGMTRGQALLTLISAAAAMAVVGYGVGAPLGVATAKALFNALARMVGLGPIPVPTDGVGLALLLPGLVVVAALGAYLPARRAARLPVVEVLREE